jgi:hypothetical protein
LHFRACKFQNFLGGKPPDVCGFRPLISLNPLFKKILYPPLSTSLYFCLFQTPTFALNGPFLGYKVIYAPIPGNETEQYVSVGQTNYIITNIDEWTWYCIKVKCYNYKGDGPASADVMVRMLEGGTYIFSLFLRSSVWGTTISALLKSEKVSYYVLIDHIVYIAPSQPPDHFNVTFLNSTSVNLTWSLPPKNSQNGIIRGFEVYYKKICNHERETIKDLPGNGTLDLHHVLDQLETYSTYAFKVLAYTLPNKKGPYSDNIIETINQDGMTLHVSYQCSF